MTNILMRLGGVALALGGITWTQFYPPWTASTATVAADASGAGGNTDSGNPEMGVARAAFFQSADMPLPPFPGGNGAPVLPDNGPAYPAESLIDASGLPDGQILPTDQPMPMPDYAQQGLGTPSRLPDTNPGQPMPSAPPNYPSNAPMNAGSMNSGVTGVGQVRPASMQDGRVLPPPMNGPPGYAPNGYPAANNGSGAPTTTDGFGPNRRQMEIATGLPYVTPAPRTGNYPTSPYNVAAFRTIAYQVPSQAIGQGAPGQGAPSSAGIANTPPVLPQNQPVLGVYPQYQSYSQCAPAGIPTYPGTGQVPGTYTPATITPNLTPGLYSPNNSGYSPLFSLGQENYNVQLGRGIIGQPTVYVPGQPFRNFLRYLSP